MSAALLETPRAAPALFETDETGWLEAMARLIAEGRFDEIDYPHLEEYLTDMAKRDRREVGTRLRILIHNRLNLEYRPLQAPKKWTRKVRRQRMHLGLMLDAETLRSEARKVLDDVYSFSVEMASIETGLPLTAFPPANFRTLEEWLALGFDP